MRYYTRYYQHIFSGILFATLMSIVNAFWRDSTFWSWFFYAAFYSFGMWLFDRGRIKHLQDKFNTIKTEEMEKTGAAVLFDDVATHIRKENKSRTTSVGGLFLTENQLLFITEDFGKHGYRFHIRFDIIESISPKRTLGIFPDRISVTLNDGREERFVVQNRNAWIEKINETMKNNP